jgi:hypothetical protein
MYTNAGSLLRHLLIFVWIFLTVGCQQSILEKPTSHDVSFFDLPSNTPGRQIIAIQKPNFVKKTVNRIKNVNCEHVIIPLMEVGSQSSAISKVGNIFFPSNGVQPTTEEAIEYSCAKIDNREDSSITIWYMQLFGMPITHKIGKSTADYVVKAGWEKKEDFNIKIPAAQEIITFSDAISENNSAL